MTCISQAILAEIENQNIHYDIYQKMAQPNNEGKREALLKKMQKKEGSYSNINKSHMNIDEPERYFKNIDMIRKDSSANVSANVSVHASQNLD